MTPTADKFEIIFQQVEDAKRAHPEAASIDYRPLMDQCEELLSIVQTLEAEEEQQPYVFTRC